ncbi:VOC family protein [Paeniglutamicibacter sp. ABSL32-1]|uniref:VOC family protein n=1 Tax=Paeniglutamicibacter quisquiliarum TaxID=2849498 RepID=UPI001C2D0F60|nr:VOC family protein [Paeniglutamicibacter quisquiliarum]MBV1778195.1 VOC family protein [Paeniglutamicibacter quisquiliarum]
MKTQGVVLSLAVADAGRSLAFYRDVVGIESARLEMGMVCLELPGMTIFLAETEAFTKYSREAKRTPLLPVPATDAFLSCAIATVAEVDEIIAAVSASEGKGFVPRSIGHTSGRLQYVGTFTDPDGHLWQLACNLTDTRGEPI